ncbi:MAG: glycosyl transferase [Clostridiales bacterium]|nr:glycosyl transferase [Clostridiales bacterium]
MKLKDKIKKVIKNPLWFIIFLNNRGFYLLGDKKYLRLLYKLEMNSKLDLENPNTFNEKLQWLKLYDRNPKYIKMVDKYEVKDYIEKTIGKEYIIPTLNVYNSFNEIDWEKLPKQFVIKCTHDSGGLIICKDKNSLDIKSSERLINKCLKNKFYYSGREWPYKNVKPRIIIEKYMATEEQPELIDYKFFCFNGNPKLLYVSEGLSDHNTAKISFADMDYKMTEFYRKDYKPFDKLPKKPENFEEMKELAKVLSKDIPFVRVDFYEIEGKIYFGELTFYPCSGYIPFKPEKYDKILGDMLELPKNKKEK